MKSPSKKRPKSNAVKKKRVYKRTTVDEIATKARELGYKFGKAKP